jgi:hypothetical protein
MLEAERLEGAHEDDQGQLEFEERAA